MFPNSLLTIPLYFARIVSTEYVILGEFSRKALLLIAQCTFVVYTVFYSHVSEIVNLHVMVVCGSSTIGIFFKRGIIGD
jgi:hypothetical protein